MKSLLSGDSEPVLEYLHCFTNGVHHHDDDRYHMLWANPWYTLWGRLVEACPRLVENMPEDIGACVAEHLLTIATERQQDLDELLELESRIPNSSSLDPNALEKF